MATKKDLERQIDYLNNKYCKNAKNEFVLSQALGGYSIALTGKTYQRGGKTRWYKGSIGSGHVTVGNPWHDTASKTLEGVYKAESRGWLQATVKQYNKRK